jgi:ribosome-associated translation inhibitor RaiA
MRITVSARNLPASDDTRGYAEYRLFSAAAPFAARVRSLDIVLDRTPGELHVYCTVRVDLSPAGHVRTQGRALHATAAIDRVADRVAWQLRRRTQPPAARTTRIGSEAETEELGEPT